MVWSAYKNILDSDSSAKEMLKLFYKKHSMKQPIYCYEIRQASKNIYYARMPRTNRDKAYGQNEVLTKFMLDRIPVIVHSFTSHRISGEIIEVVTQKTEDLYLTAFTIER